MPLPQFTPASPTLRSTAFDHDDFIFELKMDGFRALAYVAPHETRLVSRKGNVYKSFTPLCAAIHIDLDCEAVLDGEIVILGSNGRPQFYELLRRRGNGEPVFYAFDLLWLDGQDLRDRPLIERKRLLCSIIPEQPSLLLYARATNHLAHAASKSSGWKDFQKALKQAIKAPPLRKSGRVHT